MAKLKPIIHDVKQWIDENKKFFIPPICNKLMYKDGQLKTFFVGGPNSRKDFHMEEGEEFFYMLKGDMHLIVVEQGKFKDITIKEGEKIKTFIMVKGDWMFASRALHSLSNIEKNIGLPTGMEEVFLLPRRIPHSPQRLADTIGLVIERHRLPEEKDCLRYYVEDSDEILYEKWFYCKNLEELGPLIKEYFTSEQFKTGRPVPGTILDDKPIKQDFERKLEDPFSLRDWLKENEKEIKEKSKKFLFSSEEYQSRILVLGSGSHCNFGDFPETFLWQIEGRSTINMEGETYTLNENQTALVPKYGMYNLEVEKEGNVLCVVMGNPNLDFLTFNAN